MAKRWATPTQPVRIKGAQEVDETCDVYVTLSQGDRSVTVKNPPYEHVSDGILCQVTLTQEQTALFDHGQVRVQANIVDSNDYRAVTNQKRATWGSNILDERLTNG